MLVMEERVITKKSKCVKPLQAQLVWSINGESEELRIKRIVNTTQNTFYEYLPTEIDQEDEAGPIAPLISIYFVIVMVAIFIVANVSSTYIARRELINSVEMALAKASQELDEWRYYYRMPLPHSLTTKDSKNLPIDCGDAARTFSQEVELINDTRNDDSKSGNVVSIISFDCDGRELRSQARSAHHLPFTLPFLSIKEFTNVVEVAVTVRYS